MSAISKKLRWIVLLVPLLLLGSSPGTYNTWNSTYEANPPNTDPVEQGDDWIRKDKEEVRRRLDPEHQVGTGLGTTSADNGLHRVGSARCFYADTAPTVLFDSAADFDNDGSTSGTGTLSDTETNEPGRATAQTVGQARCWVDENGADGVDGTFDDNALYIYNQDPNGDTNTSDAAWEQVTNGFSGDTDGSEFHNNLALNGGFEAQNDATGTAVPFGWSLSASPAIAYSAAEAGEGGGQEVEITASGTNEGISRAYDGLKGDTSYLIVVRANAASTTTGSQSCSMRTTGGTASTAALTTTTAAYETLVDSFTTDALGNPVTVILESDTDTDVCKFDNLGIYEIGSATVHPAVPSTSSFVYREVAGNTSCIPNADCTVFQSPNFLIPSDSCTATVTASLDVSAASSSGTFTPVSFILSANINGAGYTENLRFLAPGAPTNWPFTTGLGGSAVMVFGPTNTGWASGNTAAFLVSWDSGGGSGTGGQFGYYDFSGLTVDFNCPGS